MSESAAPITPESAGMSPIAKVIGVFTAPAKTFEAIARKPGWDWLVPVALVMASLFIAQSVELPRMDVDGAVKTQMKFVDKMAKGSLTDDKRAQIEQQTREGIERGKTPVRRIIVCLTLFIPVFLVPGIYFGIAAAFGAKKTYMTVVAGYAYTWVIQTIPLLLTAVVAIPHDKLDANDIQWARVLKSNVGAFLDFETTHKALLGLLSSVDVFDIWAFVIGSIALSKTTKFSPKTARLVVGGVWGTYIFCKVILGFVLQSFIG